MTYDDWKLDSPYNHEKIVKCTCKVCDYYGDSDEFVEEDLCINCHELQVLAKKLENFITDTLCTIERTIECEWVEFAGFDKLDNLPIFVSKINDDLYDVLKLNTNGKFNLSFVDEFNYNEKRYREKNEFFYLTNIDLEQYEAYSKIRFNITAICSGPAIG